MLLGDGVPADSLVLAALGPKVLRLAAERTAGAIPYLVPPEHTRQARGHPRHRAAAGARSRRWCWRPTRSGPAPSAARGCSARTSAWSTTPATCAALAGATTDLSDGGSDALIDALVARGSGEEVAAQLSEHFAAGADHVAVQLLTASDADVLDGYRKLALALKL